MVEATARRAAASRDNHLTLRRVERQQRIIELLAAARTRVPLRRLAEEFGVAERTIARDLQRLRHSGVPIEVTPGRHGGATVISAHTIPPVTLDFSEVAAVMASLAALGPSVTPSATSAMSKFARVLRH